MTTERDVYEIDTSSAVENINKLKNATEKAAAGAEKQKEKTKDLADFIKDDLRASIFSAQAAYDLLKQSVTAVAHFIGEGVKQFLEAEQANMRLSVALRNVGATSTTLLSALDAQASGLERLTGVDGEYIKSLQTMLTTMGVAPDMLERFTKAAINLSIATGTDAKAAAQQLARANAEGREDLKRYGIQIDEAAFEAKGFAVVLDEVERKFGNLAESQPEQVKQMNELSGAWKDFSEAVGSAALRLVEVEKGGTGLVTLLDRMTTALTNLDVKASGLNALKALLSSPGTALPQLLAIAADAATPNEGEWKVPDALPRVPEGPAPTGKDLKKTEEARRKALDAFKKYREEMQGISATSSANLQKLEDEENRKMMERINAQGDWEEAAFFENLKARQQMDTDALEQIKSVEEERQRIADERLAKEKAHWESMRQAAEGYFNSFLSSQFAFISEALTSNTRFHREMFEAELARRTAGKEAVEVEAERAKMEQELAGERGAAYLKMTADSLASIAQQAAVKAVWEGVEALASLAVGDVRGAGLHGAAAAGYAGLAVAAGGTAAALSGARGLTGEEKKQLEAATKTKEERTKREKEQSSERALQAGTIVNVYNLGITGQTTVEQGRELDRIRKQYEATKTGGM